jgi:hypothetical protein
VIGAYDVEIEYDENVLNFVDATGEDLPDPTVSEPTDGTIEMDTGSLTAVPVPLTAATLTFEVESDASAGESAAISLDDANSAFTGTFSDVTFMSQDGSVTVDGNDPGSVEVTNLDPVDITAQPDEQITVSGDVTNQGSSLRNVETRLKFSDGNARVVASKPLSLPAGATKSVSFDAAAPSSEGEYTYFIETDDDSSQDGSLTVQTNPLIGITIGNVPLTANQQSSFYADVGGIDGIISSTTWDFGDGTTKTGQAVSHMYTTDGTYSITLSVETQDGQQFTTTREVTVDPAQSTFDIIDVRSYLDDSMIEDFTHVEGLDLNLAYGVTVTQPSSTANVTFELGDITHTDTDGSDGWRFPVPTTQLAQNETLTVTAYGTNGERAVASKSLTVLQTPEWFDLLSPVQQFKQRPVIELQGEFPAGSGSAVQLPNQFPFADDVPLPVVGSSQSNNVKATVSVRINLRTTEATVGVGGNANYDLSSRVAVSGSVSGSASMRLYKMDIVGGTLTAQAGAEVTFPGIPNPPIGPVPPGIVKLYPIFGIQLDAEAGFDEVDSVNNNNPVAFELTRGSVTPELYARQELGQKFPVAELVFGLEEGVNTTVPFPSFEPIYGNAFAQAYFRARWGPFTARISYPPGQERFAYRFGPLGGNSGATDRLPGTQTSGSPSTVAWQPVNRTGPAPPGRQPSQRVAATRTGSSVPSVAPAAIADARITNNTVADETPAVAQTGRDGITLVWSQQQIDRSVFNGRDILASNTTDGTSFDGSTAVTDDNVSDYYPAIAAADDSSGSALAAFTTFDRTFNSSNTTGPGDLYPHGEIRVARLNDSTWEPPTFLTNDSTFDFQPTVVSQDDNWTIAWTRDADANLSTWRDREVAYARYDENGQVGPVHSIDEARSPVLTTINGTTRIAYLDMRGGERSGQLVMGDLQRGQSSPVTRATYPVENLTDVAAANDTVVWTTANAQPWMQVATTEDVRNLSAPEGLTPPQSVTLGARSDRLLLTFRAASPNSSVAEAYYKPRVDGVWLPARRYASGTDRNLTYWQTATTGTDDGFTSVMAGKVLDSEQKDDLFAFRAQFRPDLAVSVRDHPENVTVGMNVNLTANVTNNGGNPTNATTVAISNGSGIVASSPVPGLQPGESIERSLAAVLDETGQVTVEVDPGGQIQGSDDTNNQETLQLQRPDLAVTDRTVTRRDGTIQVNATIGNPSSVTAPAVTYRYSNGPTLNRSGSVGPIPPQSTREVSVDFAPGNLSSSFPLTIRIDPAQTLPESDETNNTLVGPIQKPDVRLSKEQVNYYRQNGTVVASVLVENAGIGGGEGTINVRYAANGSAIAGQPFEVGPALTTGSSTFSRERVVLPGVSENTTVTLTATVRPRNARTSPIVDRAATTEAIELNTTLLPPTGSLRLSRTPAVVNHSLLVGVQASDDGTVTSTDWTVTNGTIVSNRTTEDILTVVPDNASSLSVGVTLTDDDGLTEQVVRTVTTTPNQRPVIADYATDQGTVEMSGLFDAIDDWRAGSIDTLLLLELIDAWRSEKPIV